MNLMASGAVLCCPSIPAKFCPWEHSKEFVVTSIYLTQQFGELGSLLLGKINVIDLLAADPFFGGWGILRFMNVAFVAGDEGPTSKTKTTENKPGRA